jgi:beta-mannosidase
VTRVRLRVTAQTYTRDSSVLADRVAADAHVDEALVTLLPEETATFEVRTTATVRPAAFLDPLVLRSANQLAIQWPASPATPGIVRGKGVRR